MNELEPLEAGSTPDDNEAPHETEPEIRESAAADIFEDALEEEFDLDDEYEDEDDEDDAESASYMQNRELSWLTFNERVLDQGADESVPLLERLNFISIFWSNLQEFFMVRVGSLTDLSFIEPPVIDSKSGMTPKEQIRAIHERCSELYPIQESYYEHVRGSLAKEGVRHLRPEDISDEQRNYLFGLIQHNIEPFLSPQIINSRHPFPHLENGKLYILVRLDDAKSAEERKKKKKEKGKKKDKAKGAADDALLGLIPLPHQCERIIKLPGRGFQFILLEHAIEMFVPEIFSMYKIKHTNVICVTRNADIDANQGFDEQDEDYREHMKRLLKKRARLAPVRLECERPLSPVMEKLMLNKLDLKRYQVYDTIVPLDLSFTWGLGSYLSEKKQARLSNTPFTPAWPTCFDKNKRIMDQVENRETLLFYPYESMDPFVQLLREAAVDPDVVSIKITLYRLASQSHLAEALIAAADNGKEVTALFELRARFDESNNIEWSQRFEEAGCNVIYGFRDYKVHSKICCITRRTPNGLQHITQLGTGNYNEKTAKLYTDLSFITTSEEFGRDAVEFFRNMQLENVSDNYNVLQVAPLQIKPLILNNLDKQIENARQGKPARAMLKANSITDKDVIEKISEASNAGVKITLFIRGICCLVPRIKGATENVRVFSIVGRLLEHSRIYCFGTDDDCVVYLSSADLMTRNLNKRVEIAWPVLDVELRDRILTYFDICLRDTAKLRELRANATYTPLGAFCELDDEGNSKPTFDSQNTLIDQAAEAARITSEMEAGEKVGKHAAKTDAAQDAVEVEVAEAEELFGGEAEDAAKAAEDALEPEPEGAAELDAAAAEAEPALEPEPEGAAELDAAAAEAILEPAIAAEPAAAAEPEPTAEAEATLQPELELAAEPEPASEQAAAIDTEEGASYALEEPLAQNAVAAVAAAAAAAAEAVEASPASAYEPEPAQEPSGVSADYSTSQSDTIETQVDTMIQEASNRVAELLSQFENNSGQVAESVREPLPDLKIDGVLSSIAETAETVASETTQQAEAQTVEAAEQVATAVQGATAGQSAADGQDAIAEQSEQAATVATAVEQAATEQMATVGEQLTTAEQMATAVEQAATVDEQAAAVTQASATAGKQSADDEQAAAVASATTSTPATQDQAETQTESATGDFFEKNSGEIQIPKKKKGFFARLFGGE